MKKKMNLKSWFHQNSVLKKMIISYVILFVLLIASNLFIYIRTENLLMSKEITYNRMALEYTRDIMDQNLESIYNFCTDLMINQDMQNRLRNLESMSNQVYLIDRLMNFTQKNEFVEHAIIWTPSSNSMLCESGSLSPSDTFSSYLQNGNLRNDIILDRYKQADIGCIPKKDINLALTPQDEDGSYIVLCYSSAYVAKGTRLLLLIPEERIRELFKDVYGGSQFMMFTEDARYIVKPEKDPESTELMEQLLASSAQHNDGHFLYDNNLVIHCNSGLFHWEYTAIIDCADIFQEVTLLRTVTIILMLSMLLVCSIVVVLSIQQTYMPLKDIMNFIGKGKPKSHENEYDEIKHELLNLKKNNLTYKENLTLYELIQHGTDGHDLHEFFSKPCICSIMLAGAEDEISGSCIKALEDTFVRKHYSVHLVKYSLHEMYFILNGDILCIEEITETLQQFWAQHQIRMLAGIGSAETVQNLKQSCDQAKRAVRHGRICTSGCIYIGEPEDTDCIRFPLDFENRMMSFIYAADKAAVRDFIEEIFRSNQGIDWTAFNKLTLDFYENYKRLASKLQAPIDERTLKNIGFFGYQPEQTKLQLQKLYSDMVFDLPVDKRASSVSTFIKEYINDNYRDSGITIEAIAEELDLAPTYVSTLFKREALVPFSQYLSDFRIQKAIDLLEHTDMKIKDVALEVGFGTYSNFARTFKKKLGITPVEFKNQNNP